MAPVVHSAPTAVQMPPKTAAEKYKSYVRSNSNPNPQYDDNLKEPNNNNPNFKNTNIGNKKSNNIKNVQDPSQQFFTCYTSYSCTPADAQAVQSEQPNQEQPQVKSVPNNNQLKKGESGKPGPNAQFNNVMNAQSSPQPVPQIKVLESSGHPSQVNKMNKLNSVECGKPAPHAQFNNIKNTPSIPCPPTPHDQLNSVKNTPCIPSPLVMKNNVTPLLSPPQRSLPKPIGEGKPQGHYGLGHSRSSPAIPSKGSPSQNESLVLHYFQNPHTYKNLQETQLPGQGPVPKSMLPPPAPPAAKSKSKSRSNSCNERRGSVPNAQSDDGNKSCNERRGSLPTSLPNGKSGDGKSKEWQSVLTKFYQW